MVPLHSSQPLGVAPGLSSLAGSWCFMSEVQGCSSPVACSALSQGLIALQVSNLYLLACVSGK